MTDPFKNDNNIAVIVKKVLFVSGKKTKALPKSTPKKVQSQCFTTVKHRFDIFNKLLAKYKVF